MGRVQETLQRLGIELPPVPAPVASYLPWVRAGTLVQVSGQLPSRGGKLLYAGKVPSQITPEAAREAASLAALNALAALQEACGGDLDRVEQVLRLGIFVQSDAEFTAQPAIANGASDLLAQILGPAGRHARVAVGTNTLPLNATVELELLAVIRI